MATDSDLAKEEYIAFNARSHTDGIVRFADYRKVAHPKLTHISVSANADICNLRTART